MFFTTQNTYFYSVKQCGNMVSCCRDVFLGAVATTGLS